MLGAIAFGNLVTRALQFLAELGRLVVLHRVRGYSDAIAFLSSEPAASLVDKSQTPPDRLAAMSRWRSRSRSEPGCGPAAAGLPSA